MANTYKNIVITPNRSSNSDDPKITFSGANTTANTDITLRMYPTSNGTLSVEGSAGQLFSITNDMSGTIYSVNDVSGIPSIEVLSSGLVKLAQYSGPITLGSNTSTITNYGNVVVGSTTVINSSGYWVGPSPTAITGPMTITGNSSYVGDWGYSTLILQDGGGYAGINFRNGNNNWIQRMEAGGSEMKWGYSGNASGQGVGTYTEYLRLNTDYLYHTSDMRSPLFYDSDNTSYYCDPLSGQVFGGVTRMLPYTAGGVRWIDTFNNSMTNWQGSTSQQTTWGFAWRYNDSGNTRAMIAYDHASSEEFQIASGYGPIVFNVDLGNSHLDSPNEGTEVLRLSTYATAPTSMRSPIFYDSDNTNYYVDPASTSVVSDFRLASGNIQTVIGNVGQNLKLRALAGTSDLGVTFYDANDNWRMQLYASSGNYGFLDSNWGGWDLRKAPDGALYMNGDNSYYLRTDSESYMYRVYGAADIRSPIFYDNDDTNYYLNPASTSVLNRISVVRSDGNVYTDANYGYGLVGTYASTRYQGVFAMGDSYKLSADGTSVGTLYGIAWSHYNAGGAAANLASHGMLILENGTFKGAWGGGRIVTTSDVRGTLFYDYDNTGYYVDPNAGTSVNVAGAIQAGGNITAYYSDERLKTKLGYIDQPLNKLMSITAFYYEANQTAQKLGYKPKREVGLSAQEIQTILPEIVAPAPLDNNYLTIDYARVVPLLVEAIKELNQKHETEIAELKQALAALLNKQ